MEHQHISKVLEWGFSADHNFMATLWGCVLCEAGCKDDEGHEASAEVRLQKG